MSATRKTKPVAKLSFEDVWQRRATEAAIAAARGVVKPDGPVPPLTPVGRLSDTEWGWIAAAILSRVAVLEMKREGDACARNAATSCA